MPIPWREHGYNAFSSTSLSTQAELDAFLRTAKAKGGWNRFAAFEKALADTRIDWRKESLVLLRHTEHSGSIRVVPQAPRQQGRTLTIAVDRKAPEVRTADMAYYAIDSVSIGPPRPVERFRDPPVASGGFGAHGARYGHPARFRLRAVTSAAS